MNANDFNFLLNNPSAVSDGHLASLDKIVDEFPYFQSARALQLKGLHEQKSFRYNQALKVTAAYTTDRNVLFDFITSNDFSVLKNQEQEKTQAVIEPIWEEPMAEESFFEEPISAPVYVPENKLEQSIIISIEEADFHKNQTVVEAPVFEQTETAPVYVPENKLEQSIIISIEEAAAAFRDTFSKPEFEPAAETFEEKESENSVESIEEKLEIGKPLEFSNQEKHSFSEWLQLSKIQPIDRTETKRDEAVQEEIVQEEIIQEEVISEEQETEEPVIPEEDEDRKWKLELIDKFIESNPKIVPVKNAPVTPAFIEQPPIENSYLMTETLAKVYLEQKKYQKAIQAYEILILKYPEKISFFAERIADIKTLQQNNN